MRSGRAGLRGDSKSFLGNVGERLADLFVGALKDEVPDFEGVLRPAGNDLVLSDDGVLRSRRAQKHDDSDDCEREWVSCVHARSRLR